MRTMKGRILTAALLAFGTAAAHAGIAIKTIAEVEQKEVAQGKERVSLVPAARVLPGTQVFYTVEVRNTGDAPATAVTVTNPVPEHMLYVADWR